ncbi:MAG: Fe-S protein assembly co-chaperone HscB [Saezia sp.]
MATLSLTDNDFSILGLPQQFEQDETFLSQRWKDLQTHMHPDRFATQGAAAGRLATQWSIRINESFQNIKDPIKRASLLCELAGTPVNLNTNTSMPPEFLMQQMQWREELEEAQTAQQIDAIQHKVFHERTRIMSTLEWLLDEKSDYAQAAQQIKALVFMDRFLESIYTKQDGL